jgi:hypothetical protein
MEVYPHLVHIEISDFEVIVGAETQRHLLDLRGNQVQFEPGTLSAFFLSADFHKLPSIY